jgi:hypothetical protein
MELKIINHVWEITLSFLTNYINKMNQSQRLNFLWNLLFGQNVIYENFYAYP